MTRPRILSTLASCGLLALAGAGGLASFAGAASAPSRGEAAAGIHKIKHVHPGAAVAPPAPDPSEDGSYHHVHASRRRGAHAGPGRVTRRVE